MNTQPADVSQDWHPVRLTTAHCVLETRLSTHHRKSLASRNSHTLPNLLCLPETTLRFRTDPDVPLLLLAHCVVTRSQILQIDEAIIVLVEIQVKETRPARLISHPPQHSAYPRTRLHIPITVTPRDFFLQSLRLLTHDLILDAQMAVYSEWSTRSPTDWIRHDPRALFSLSSVIIRTRDTHSTQAFALLTLDSCELPRAAILDATSCPAA